MRFVSNWLRLAMRPALDRLRAWVFPRLYRQEFFALCRDVPGFEKAYARWGAQDAIALVIFRSRELERARAHAERMDAALRSAQTQLEHLWREAYPHLSDAARHEFRDLGRPLP